MIVSQMSKLKTKKLMSISTLEETNDLSSVPSTLDLKRYAEHNKIDLLSTRNWPSIRYFIQVIKTLFIHLFNNHPNHYVKVLVTEQQLRFFHIQNNQIIERCLVNTTEITQSDFDTFMKSKQCLPLHIVINTDDIEFKHISFQHIPWYHRPFYIKKYTRTDFDPDEWIYTMHTPKDQDPHLYTFISYRPTSSMIQSLLHLKQLPNPIVSIQLNVMQQMAAALLCLKRNNIHTLSPWTLLVKKESSTEWLIAVYHQSAMTMVRIGRFMNDIKNLESTPEEQIQEEIQASLKYLTRFGFKDNDHVTIIAAGFQDAIHTYLNNDRESSKIKIDCVYTLSSRELDTHLFLHKTNWIKNSFAFIQHNIHQKSTCVFEQLSSLFQKGFSPRFFKTQQSAFFMPIYTMRALIPLCGMITLWFSYTIINLDHTLEKIHVLEQENTQISNQIGSSVQQHNAKIFKDYKQYAHTNPLYFLKFIKRNIGRGAVLKQYTWTIDQPIQTKKNDVILKRRFEAHLSLPPRIIMNRNKILPESLHAAYLDRVKTNIEKQYPVAVTFKHLSKQSIKKNLGAEIEIIYLMTIDWRE